MADSSKTFASDELQFGSSTPRLSRRRALGLGLALGTMVVGTPCLGQADDGGSVTERKRSGLLVQPSQLDALDTRAKIVLELDGELRLKEPDPSKVQGVRKAEVKAKSTLDYFEKSAFEDSKLVAAARRYVVAKSENWISGSASSQELRPQCFSTRMLPHDGIWQQFCPGEPLDVRETELLHSPINTAALELFLPEKPAKPSSKWAVSNEAAKSLFNLEAVHRSSISVGIAKVEKGVATLSVDGELEATAQSVPTSLKVKGNLNVEFASRGALVTWLGLVIQETREISQAEPGFSITARVRVLRKETESELPTTPDALRQLAVDEDRGRWLVRLQSTAGRYSMLADRRWTTYLDTGEEAILRMIEHNSVIAQCTVTRLPKLEEGSQLTLEGMQADIQKSLGKSFVEFLESEEKVTSGKLRQLRSVVSGEAEEVPIQWIYNHLSDDSGRRIAMIFTMGGNVTDRFAAADEQMTASFELIPESEATTEAPTPAPKLSSTEAEAPKR